MSSVPKPATSRSSVRVERLACAGRELRGMGTTRALFGALPRLAAEVCQGEGGLLARLDGLELAVVSSDGGGPGLSLASVRAAVRRTISSGETERVHVPAPPGEPLEIMVVPVAAPPERWALVVALRDPAAASAGVTLEVLTTMVGACVDRISAAERQGHAAPAADGDGAPSRPPSRWAARMTFADLIGEDPAFVDCVELARRAAQSELPLLVTGETGTGKEMLAQAIHNSSSRRREPFVGINVAAIPLELLESELFGYERGAFTSARSGGKPGLFEVAEGGTLLLDEIGDMPLDLQVKLLRVLQERVVYRLGGTREIPIRARIMATTHRDLRRASQEGSFRSDLYYRLRVVHLRIPPLRERRSDIPRLIDACLTRFASRAGRSKPIVAPRVLAAYAEHDWPGNVRELMHLVEAEASLLAPNETVIHRTPTLQGLLATSAPAPASRQAPVSEAPPPSAATAPPASWPAERPPDSLSAGSAPVTRMEEVERQAYVEALERFEGNVSKAAQALGVSRGTFYNKMRRHGIEARGQARPSTPPKGS